MKYLTETKVCTPDGHVLGVIDSDKQAILCIKCQFRLGELSKINIGRLYEGGNSCGGKL